MPQMPALTTAQLEASCLGGRTTISATLTSIGWVTAIEHGVRDVLRVAEGLAHGRREVLEYLVREPLAALDLDVDA